MGSIDYSSGFRIPMTVQVGEHPREDSPIEIEMDFSQALRQLKLDGEFDINSIRLLEMDGEGRVTNRVPVQFEPGEGFAPHGRATGKLSWILDGWTPPYGERNYALFFDILESGAKQPLEYGTGVTFRRFNLDPMQDRAMSVAVGGQFFTTYNYGWKHSSLYKPFFCPLLGPSGKSVIQNGEFPGSLRGHYWHRGLFVAHQLVNGYTFWEEWDGEMRWTGRDGKLYTRLAGRILHQEFVQLVEGPVSGYFLERNRWRKPDGSDVLEELRGVRIYNLPADRRIVDLRLILKPIDEDVVLGKTPYQMLACRLAGRMNVTSVTTNYNLRNYEDWELRAMGSGGLVVDSEGRINVDPSEPAEEVRAKWMDHSGPADGGWEGVAIFDSPVNERYPTAWLNWNLMTMGPSFTRGEEFVIPCDGALTLSYRVYVHKGDAWMGKVAQKFADYANPVTVTLGDLV